MPTPPTKGDLIVVSAPSGAGKTTLVRRLLRRVGELEFSVSYTTRPARRGEREAVDYHFITPARFRRMIREREFLEWAEVYGHFYGTRKRDLLRILRKGKDVLLDLDTQGAGKVRKRLPGAISVFILPPAAPALNRRLRGRGLDSADSLRRRYARAAGEIRHFPYYDYLIVNDRLDPALRFLEAVILSARCRLSRTRPQALKILKTFQNSKRRSS